MARRRTYVQDTPPAAPAASGGSLLTIFLLAVVAFAGWQAYGNPKPGPGPVQPVPVVEDETLAALVFPTAARLQSDNYVKAAERLEAGDAVYTVNEELLSLNKAAIEAAYAPLDAWMAKVLADADPAQTAAVYRKIAKEVARGP